MRLTKYKLNGPAVYVAEQVVWVRIQETQDTDIVGEFLTWKYENKIRTFDGPNSSGGGQISMGFYPEDLPIIEAWLKEHGVVEVKPEEEDTDGPECNVGADT